MLGRLAHRGSDALGVWCAGAIGLGHRLLVTTPESLSERLPALNTRAALAITADARIDNRCELMQALHISEPAAADSSLILAAYERWAERCVEHLLGDFAFAIWDARTQSLLCARDHFGVR